ncbi:head maturation protease, ClpP-related [Enterocloster citroniae]|uniref:head maturation protease, ClpP-related n=1 Tax=Enterocloster citroniae TaxID=358743 RepID=UPI001898E8CD|nr:head maturation protease, ClpP-related [Enterocloster citroniae]
MKTKKFWKWRNQAEAGTAPEERTLFLNGTIAEESWFDDDVTPQLFKDELNAGSGDITVWINSPGGDCVAAAQIYNMLSNYKGKVTVKIDGIAASAASVIAMAGDTVLVSPVSMLMIHNPATIAWGDHAEMQKAIDMLSEVKESIINAYVLKTGLSRPKLSHLMDAETWMDANKAVELGFADEIMMRAKAEPQKEPEESEGDTDGEEEEEKKFPPSTSSMLFSRRAANNALLNKLAAKYGGEKPKADIQAQAQIPAPDTETGRSVDALMERLNLLKR